MMDVGVGLSIGKREAHKKGLKKMGHKIGLKAKVGTIFTVPTFKGLNIYFIAADVGFRSYLSVLGASCAGLPRLLKLLVHIEVSYLKKEIVQFGRAKSSLPFHPQKGFASGEAKNEQILSFVRIKARKLLSWFNSWLYDIYFLFFTIFMVDCTNSCIVIWVS